MAKWDQLDSQVVNTKMSIYADAKGMKYEDPSNIIYSVYGVSNSYYIDSPSSGIEYHKTPADWGHISIIENDTWNAMNVRFDFKRGTSTWSDELSAGFGTASVPPIK
ncbi:hypothetical protein L1765_00665 [Microaerobacter geothermalis]|uniref:hypothetical protein n=1 Tax=Microaerobacter geothermalis TaxID=674972 RepID=UPI001F26C29E|nr:hypothetical protein [Microaerobacter geothermalis]MCF6092504.1 hypothetical protein [Microaerobacter geothermalis]